MKSLKRQGLRRTAPSFTVNQSDSFSNAFLGFPRFFMSTQANSSNEMILVAEDNAFVRMQIAKFLKDGGYQVMEANDGEQALTMLEQHDFGLAMVDVRMEPVDGFEFIRTIRGLDVTIPVVLVTGDSNPDLLEQANKWGVSAVLIKPVQKERLMKTVERTIQAYRREA